jgi:tyrosinase
LCSNDVFKADQIATRVPELAPFQSRPGMSFPPADVGLVEPRPSVCENCLARWPSVMPCLLTRCKEFPLPRKARIRKNIYSLTPTEIQSLRAGIAAMKARPETDPTSYVYQAKMHAVDSGSPSPLQDGCQHRQFYFFPWHRMYVFYFERMLRKASGDPNLTLPYWNYTDVAAQRAIPEPYRVPADASNPLYDETRAPVYNAGVPLPAADVSYAAAFAALAFTAVGPSTTFGGGTVTSPQHFPSPGASGLLERSPHNNVHNDVNGDMATGESPRDPVFWLHHSNIDRLWNKWIELGAPRSNPTSDANWMNQTFSFFDENGTQVSLTGATILNTVDQLGYRYDDDPYAIAAYWPPPAQRGAVGAPLTPAQNVASTEVVLEQKGEVRLTAKPSTVPMRLPQAKRAVMQKSVDTKAANERYILQLRGVKFDKPVGVTYLLFLNLPANARSPDEKHPNFVGTLGFFGHGGAAGAGHHDHAEEGTTESYDITELVKRLGKIADLKLTIVPSYPAVPADRKDLADLVKKLKPAGEPRIAEIAILKQAAPAAAPTP